MDKNENQLFTRRLRKRIYDLLPAALTVYGIVGILFFTFYKDFQSDFSRTYLIVFAVMGIVGAFLSMNNYLQKSKIESKEYRYETSDEKDFSRLIERLDFRNYELQARIEKEFHILNERLNENRQKEPAIDFDETQKKEIFNALVNTISTNLTKDFFDSIKENVKGQIIDDKREQIFSIVKRCDSSLSRLKGEIDLLTKRANINLIIGSIITIAALILLGYFVVRENFNSEDIFKVSLHFIPRLSLVVFIELFSFFFLKLYRTSLQEIKYYQNELTNLELKQTAIITAANYGTESDISNIIREMSLTERNFKLQKGESTVDLEKNRMETQSLKEILKASIGAIGKNK